MKRIILGTTLLLSACSGGEAKEETAYESSESALYDKSGRPLINTLVADIAWNRCDPRYDDVADKGRIPPAIIYGYGLPQIDLKNKTVGAIGCISYGRRYKGDDTVLHYGPNGPTRGWPAKTINGGGGGIDFERPRPIGGGLVFRDSTADTSMLTSISVVKHEVLGTGVDPLWGEQCTVGAPDKDFRNNPPDGMRKDGANMPTGIVDHGFCDIAVPPYKAICTVTKRLAGGQQPLWLKPSNRAQHACHP
jgi:hypothetical protein